MYSRIGETYETWGRIANPIDYRRRLFLARISPFIFIDSYDLGDGALATAKSTHISVVVPMTVYGLCSVSAYYVPFDDKQNNYLGGNVESQKDKTAEQVEMEMNETDA